MTSMTTASVGPMLPAMTKPPATISRNCALPGGRPAKATHMNSVVSTAATAGTINRALGIRELRRSATALQTSAPTPPTSTTMPVLSPA